MKYMVGYQRKDDDSLLREIFKWKEQISEVYFSWGDMPSGRGATADRNGRVPFAEMTGQKKQLKMMSDAGISLNLLLNANCYGRDSLSGSFYCSMGDLIAYLSEELRICSVTTTSPPLARFIKLNFPQLEVRASVNMEIGTIEGMEYLQDEFDGYYYKRELNRDIRQVEILKRWCDIHGKKLYMLANSGCLNFCSARIFHDNLVAHEGEIFSGDHTVRFESACRRFLKRPGGRERILSYMNFVRPEEMSYFEPYVEAAKLATRVSPRPEAIIRAYMSGGFQGNVLELLEPNHADLFYPSVLDNERLPEDYCLHVSECKRNCRECSYCRDAAKDAWVSIENGGVSDVNQCDD